MHTAAAVEGTTTYSFGAHQVSIAIRALLCTRTRATLATSTQVVMSAGDGRVWEGDEASISQVLPYL